MDNKRQMTTGEDGKPQGGPDRDDLATRGNSLEDAAEEATRFMEEGDEPGHAGRGDGG